MNKLATEQWGAAAQGSRGRILLALILMLLAALSVTTPAVAAPAPANPQEATLIEPLTFPPTPTEPHGT